MDQTQQQPQQQYPGYNGNQGYYNQYYQNYYQQQEPVETHADQPESKKSANKKFLIGIGVSVLLIIVFVGVFYLPDMFGKGEAVVKQKETNVDLFTPPAQSDIPQLSIDEIKFCSFIDENYNCNEKQGNSFFIGDEISVLVKVSGFEQMQTEEGWIIGIKENVAVKDMNNTEIPELTGNALSLSEFTSSKQESINLKNIFPTFLIVKNPGTYSLEIQVVDRIASKNVTKIATFVME